MATRDDAKQSLRRFSEEVLYKPPLFDYFSSSVVSTLGRERPDTPPEHAEDFCFLIGLLGELPAGVVLVDEYDGFPIVRRFESQAVQH